MIFQTPDFYWDLLRSIFVTLLKKLSSEIVLFYFFQRQFLQLCFKYASEQIIGKISCSKYQTLFKTLIRNIFKGIYCCAHKTATLTSIQHTVPLPLAILAVGSLWYLMIERTWHITRCSELKFSFSWRASTGLCLFPDNFFVLWCGELFI